MTLPAPDWIEPGLCPGGLVFQTWRRRPHTEPVMLFEHRLASQERPEHLEYPDEIDFVAGDMVTLLVYDGDTGDLSWKLGLR